jgi:hypothetical protein
VRLRDLLPQYIDVRHLIGELPRNGIRSHAAYRCGHLRMGDTVNGAGCARARPQFVLYVVAGIAFGRGSLRRVAADGLSLAIRKNPHRRSGSGPIVHAALTDAPYVDRSRHLG